MRKEDCDWIKKNLVTVQAGIPREHKFQITLADVLRLYGDYGTKEELDKCLRDLEKEGILKKTSSTYIFADEVRRRLSYLNIENQRVNEEREHICRCLDAIGGLQDLWLDRLPTESLSYSQLDVIEYFISVYWQSKSGSIRKRLSENEEKRKKIENEIFEIKKVLEEP